ncbi:hypothetical protein QQZ08_006562 [Neonectria magnoliae]|uniref:Uncharacterized protein n=1 Tax=Neonectria magnoliae TaxID=2732573 RepID=A0ABR1I1S9_9HYPO
MPGYDVQDLDASIVAVDADKTTFAISCPTDADSSECGVPEGGQTVIYGPETFSMAYSYDGGSDYGSYSQDVACKFQPKKDMATCTVSVSQDSDGSTFDSSTATSTSGYLDLLLPVTVTAGANKLRGEDVTASATGTDAETTAAAPASTSGATDTTATESASESASDAASTSATASDNAAGAMITQNAVLAGVAVLAGGAMLL